VRAVCDGALRDSGAMEGVVVRYWIVMEGTMEALKNSSVRAKAITSAGVRQIQLTRYSVLCYLPQSYVMCFEVVLQFFKKLSLAFAVSSESFLDIGGLV
jgi:hypothetical protein